MRVPLKPNELAELRRLVYDATIYELAEVIFKEHRDEELAHLIKLIQTRVEESNED